MTCSIYTVTKEDNGKVKPGPISQIRIISFIEKTQAKNFRGSGIEVSNAAITCTDDINSNSVLRIDPIGRWYKKLTHDRGILGVFKHYLQEAPRPSFADE